MSRLPALTINDLVYDPATHTSRLLDGRKVPHVTAVLGAVGAATDYTELAGMSLHIGEAIENARTRGTAVHEDCHAFDDGDLIFETVHPAVLPYVSAWGEFRNAMNIKPLERERRLFHSTYIYTGIMDGIFKRGRDHVLIDIKTGNPDDSACHLQTAAYESAWRSMTGFTGRLERWAVQLMPKTRAGYRVTDYSGRKGAAGDFGTWLACLCVYNEQLRRKART